MNILNLFSDNIVINKIIGLFSLTELSKSKKNMFKISLLLLFLIVITNIICYSIYYPILKVYDLEYLKTPVFIIIVSLVILLTELLLKKVNLIKESNVKTIFLNGIIFGITLLSISNQYNFYETILFSIGSWLGFIVITYLVSTISMYLNTRDIDQSFKGYPILFITLGIIALLFARIV